MFNDNLFVLSHSVIIEYDWIMDIHDWIMDIHNWIMVIHN